MHRWNGLHEYYTMETQKCEKISKSSNWRNWILSVPRVSVCRETKSPWLRQYQFYISNWYVNGKVFTSTTTWEPRNLIFLFKKVRNRIWLLFWLELKSLNQHSSRSQHAPICRHRDASSSLWGSTSSSVLGAIWDAVKELRISWSHRKALLTNFNPLPPSVPQWRTFGQNFDSKIGRDT